MPKLSDPAKLADGIGRMRDRLLQMLPRIGDPKLRRDLGELAQNLTEGQAYFRDVVPKMMREMEQSVRKSLDDVQRLMHEAEEKHASLTAAAKAPVVKPALPAPLAPPALPDWESDHGQRLRHELLDRYFPTKTAKAAVDTGSVGRDDEWTSVKEEDDDPKNTKKGPRQDAKSAPAKPTPPPKKPSSLPEDEGSIGKVLWDETEDD